MKERVNTQPPLSTAPTQKPTTPLITTPTPPTQPPQPTAKATPKPTPTLTATTSTPAPPKHTKFDTRPPQERFGLASAWGLIDERLRSKMAERDSVTPQEREEWARIEEMAIGYRDMFGQLMCAREDRDHTKRVLDGMPIDDLPGHLSDLRVLDRKNVAMRWMGMKSAVVEMEEKLENTEIDIQADANDLWGKQEKRRKLEAEKKRAEERKREEEKRRTEAKKQTEITVSQAAARETPGIVAENYRRYSALGPSKRVGVPYLGESTTSAQLQMRLTAAKSGVDHAELMQLIVWWTASNRHDLLEALLLHSPNPLRLLNQQFELPPFLLLRQIQTTTAPGTKLLSHLVEKREWGRLCRVFAMAGSVPSEFIRAAEVLVNDPDRPEKTLREIAQAWQAGMKAWMGVAKKYTPMQPPDMRKQIQLHSDSDMTEKAFHNLLHTCTQDTHVWALPPLLAAYTSTSTGQNVGKHLQGLLRTAIGRGCASAVEAICGGGGLGGLKYGSSLVWPDMATADFVQNTKMFGIVVEGLPPTPGSNSAESVFGVVSSVGAPRGTAAAAALIKAMRGKGLSFVKHPELWEILILDGMHKGNWSWQDTYALAKMLPGCGNEQEARVQIRKLCASPLKHAVTEGDVLTAMKYWTAIYKLEIPLDATGWDVMRLVKADASGDVLLESLCLRGAAAQAVNHRGENLLHMCMNASTVRILLPHLPPSHINAPDNEGLTPLHCAAQSGYDQIVEELLKAGADPQAKDKLGRTPTVLAKKSARKILANYIAKMQQQQAPVVEEKRSESPATVPGGEGKRKKRQKKKRERTVLGGDNNNVDSGDEEQEGEDTSVRAPPKPTTPLERISEALAQRRNFEDGVTWLANKSLQAMAGGMEPPKGEGNFKSTEGEVETERKEEEEEGGDEGDERKGKGEVPPAALVSEAPTPSMRTQQSEPPSSSDSESETETSGDEISSVGVEELPWEVELTKRAKEQLFALPITLRTLVSRKLLRLARGEWADGKAKSLMKRLVGVRGLTLYESKFTRGGRILWEIAVDFSPRHKTYTELIRVWAIERDHDNVPQAITFIEGCSQRGRQATLTKRLRVVSGGGGEGGRSNGPRCYVRVDDADGMGQALVHAPPNAHFLPEGELQFYPPAAASANDAYTIMKFYSLSSELVRSLLHAQWQRMVAGAQKEGLVPVDFPFRADEVEDFLISVTPDPPCSILLLGRSGTGKTTVAVQRLWAMYKTYHDRAGGVLLQGGHLHQVFVTRNKVLRDQVRKSFRAQQAGYQPDLATRLDLDQTPPNLNSVPEESFPLFLTAQEWLLLLDSTLQNPFFQRDKDGNVIGNTDLARWLGEVGELDMIPNLEDEEEEEGVEGEGAVEKGAGKEKGGKKLCDYAMFLQLWPKMTAGSKDAQKMKPSAVFTEIFSFIKGSVVSLESPDGRLTRQQYISFPRKMAPSYANDTHGPTGRTLVYSLYEKYEQIKRSNGLYDIADFVHHLYWGLASSGGYRGVPLHHITVDEVQDFTQAELRLFVMVAADKNGLLLTGDTCQTIARGVSFRFQDLRSIFFAERGAQQAMQKRAIQAPTTTTRENSGASKKPANPVARRVESVRREAENLVKSIGQWDTRLRSGNCYVIENADLLPQDFRGNVVELDSVQGAAYRLSGLRDLLVEGVNLDSQLVISIMQQVSAVEDMRDYVVDQDTLAHLLSLMREATQLMAALDSSVVLSTPPPPTQTEQAEGEEGEKHDEEGSEERDGSGGVYGGRGVEVRVPEVSQLSVNYRSHNGVLQCANAVVELLCHYFPASVDKLAREQGYFAGPKPILLSETTTDDLCVLLVGTRKDQSMIEFGAHQVIIVRTQEAKDELPEEFDGALVMTVFEAKGLEFDDVFLWNFFHDSPCTEEWRLVTQYLRENKKEYAPPQGEGNDWPRPLEFDDRRHQILCEELKHLYTSITRARVQLVIYDQDEGKRRPMFHYLLAQDLASKVSVISKGEVGRLAMGSSAAQWRERGHNLQANGCFKLAAQCFRNSGDAREEAGAMARYLLHRAMESSRVQERKQHLIDAAEHLSVTGEWEGVGRCLYSAGEYSLAAEVYRALNQPIRAVRCLAKKGDAVGAARLLEDMGQISEAFTRLYAAKHYDQCIDLVTRRPEFTPPPGQGLTRLVEMMAVRMKDRRDMGGLMKFVKMLPSTDAQVLFLQKHGLDRELRELLVSLNKQDTLATMLCNQSKYAQAAQVLSAPGASRENMFLGAMLYEKAGSMEGDRERKRGFLSEAATIYGKLGPRYCECQAAVYVGLAEEERDYRHAREVCLRRQGGAQGLMRALATSASLTANHGTLSNLQWGGVGGGLLKDLLDVVWVLARYVDIVRRARDTMESSEITWLHTLYGVRPQGSILLAHPASVRFWALWRGAKSAMGYKDPTPFPGSAPWVAVSRSDFYTALGEHLLFTCMGWLRHTFTCLDRLIAGMKNPPGSLDSQAVLGVMAAWFAVAGKAAEVWEVKAFPSERNKLLQSTRLVEAARVQSMLPVLRGWLDGPLMGDSDFCTYVPEHIGATLGDYMFRATKSFLVDGLAKNPRHANDPNFAVVLYRIFSTSGCPPTQLMDLIATACSRHRATTYYTSKYSEIDRQPLPRLLAIAAQMRKRGRLASATHYLLDWLYYYPTADFGRVPLADALSACEFAVCVSLMGLFGGRTGRAESSGDRRLWVPATWVKHVVMANASCLGGSADAGGRGWKWAPVERSLVCRECCDPTDHHLHLDWLPDVIHTTIESSLKESPTSQLLARAAILGAVLWGAGRSVSLPGSLANYGFDLAVAYSRRIPLCVDREATVPQIPLTPLLAVVQDKGMELHWRGSTFHSEEYTNQKAPFSLSRLAVTSEVNESARQTERPHDIQGGLGASTEAAPSSSIPSQEPMAAHKIQMWWNRVRTVRHRDKGVTEQAPSENVVIQALQSMLPRDLPPFHDGECPVCPTDSGCHPPTRPDPTHVARLAQRDSMAAVWHDSLCVRLLPAINAMERIGPSSSLERLEAEASLKAVMDKVQSVCRGRVWTDTAELEAAVTRVESAVSMMQRVLEAPPSEEVVEKVQVEEEDDIFFDAEETWELPKKGRKMKRHGGGVGGGGGGSRRARATRR